MTLVRALENVLKSKGIYKEFDAWFAIAKDRPKAEVETEDRRLTPIPILLMPAD